MHKIIPLISSLLLLYSVAGFAQHDIESGIERNTNHLQNLYFDLHQTPELSFMEFNTAKKMAGELKSLGFEVHEAVSGNTLVGLFRNGDGPVIMVRTDMDALPVEEKTGLPYSSSVISSDQAGNLVSVMHACGHDMHMTVWSGTARLMVEMKDQWKGTLMMIAQQAEEQSGGAKNVIEAGLYKKFPLPDYALAYHVSDKIPAGKIGYCAGPIMAGVRSVDITVYGEGGHGAQPDRTIDPIVLASRMVVDFQTIVSRELSPLSPAVVTVGSIHGGTKHNIIPAEVNLQLTIRYYDELVGDQIIAALKRIGNGLAASANLPPEKYPLVTVQDDSTPPVINDEALTGRLVNVLDNAFGKEHILKVAPLMVGEDFGQYGLTPEKVAISLMWLGSVPQEKYDAGDMPGLHTAYYYPDYELTISTGVKGMVLKLMELFGN
ncbi:MAG: amidohydrolase [Bacteroidales bacterium]|nr:amidohydrolase [Bacteroidales bacterium]MCF8391114.1 amidohydrolase [Bacteroidales bacterium]